MALHNHTCVDWMGFAHAYAGSLIYGGLVQVAQLVDMGFDERKARAALREANGDPAVALEKLLAA